MINILLLATIASTRLFISTMASRGKESSASMSSETSLFLRFLLLSLLSYDFISSLLVKVNFSDIIIVYGTISESEALRLEAQFSRILGYKYQRSTTLQTYLPAIFPGSYRIPLLLSKSDTQFLLGNLRSVSSIPTFMARTLSRIEV